MKKSFLCAGVLIGLSGVCAAFISAQAAPVPAQTPPTPAQTPPKAAQTPLECASLHRADFSEILDAPSQVFDATLVAGTTDSPAHCLARGYVASHVGFELRLPVTGWNGKFLKVGCGGHCGSFSSRHCIGPLRRGYACVVSDMGHTGHSSLGLWAMENLQAKVDFAYRATHVTAVAGKAITERFYGRRPERSYFMGCSTGGRQGLVAAQRFPWDFDGIIVGAPVVHTTSWPFDYAWAYSALAGPDGKLILGDEDARLLHKAAVAKCDLDDGVKDGVIGNPRACRFDPAEIQCAAGKTGSCLTAAQVEAARKVYAGVPPELIDRTKGHGALIGSEVNWVNDYISYWSQRSYAQDLFRYQVFWPAAGPDWKWTDLDFERDSRRIGMHAALSSAADPDLRKYAALGGKLIVYWGLRDHLPEEITDYYETVERVMGGRAATQDFFRLFMVPGMDHCSGGSGAFAIDYLEYLEAWVEKGQAPDRMVGAHVPGLSWRDAFYLEFPLRQGTPVQFTRPVFPYPLRAKYKGTGDPNEAASFIAVQ